MKNTIALIALLAAAGLQANVVTNDFFGDISSPTTLSGVTNIIAKTQDVNITADLTLDKKTFLWLKGDASTGYVNLAPTVNDATLTIQGNSGFFAAYRYSGDGSNANSTWGKVGIDALNKDIPPGYYRMRIGTPGGAPGTTGSGKIVVKTSPSFGYNAVGGVWSRYLYVETSPKADPATGFVDILDIANGATADISHIENKSTVHPARILFRGGMLLRNNATSVDAPLSPSEGATLVLWGVDGAEIKLKKQFQNANFTGRKGMVRIVGRDLRLTHSGYTPDGVNGTNFFPWNLNAQDHVEWNLSGDIIFAENAFLRTQSADVLPYGRETGHIILQYNSGVKQSNIATQVPYCCLDLYGTEQHLNGVTSTGSGYQIGVVTNCHASAVATLVLGAQNVSGSLNAKCTERVAVVKEGTGTLSVKDATAERLTINDGHTAFSGTSAFTNITVAADVALEGTVSVLSRMTLGANVSAETLNLELGAEATLSAEGTVEVFTLKRGGVSVQAGVYSAETTDWLEAGTVNVLCTAGMPIQDVAWTGAAATESASLAANWSDGEGAFTIPRGRPVFATGGTQAVLDSGISHFMGMKFDAAGDFAVVTNGPTDSISLYGSLDVTLPGGNAARTYTVAAPVKLFADQSVVLTTNMAVRFTGGLSSPGGFGITLQGVQNTASGMMFDYSDGTVTADDKQRSGGELILENARISGPITHRKGGGWLVLRGDVGNPGDTAPLDLDYVRYRDNKSTANGLMFGGLTRLENATIWKPVSISGQGQVGGIADRWFVAAPNTTNVFKELVTCGPSTALCGQKYTRMIYEKGVYVNNGGFNPRSLNTSSAADAATHVFNGPVRMDSTSRQLCPNSEARLVFNSTGNYSKLCVQSQHAVFEFNVDDAWDNTGFILDGDRARLELGTTHQKMPWLISGTINNTNPQWFADNAAKRARGTVNGAYPAALEITWGAPTESACAVTNCGVKFTGWVKLEKSGDGFLEMLPLAHTSFGDVEVSGGTLAFDAGTTWLNGTNVTVKGTGKLKLGSGNTFQDFCNVYAEGENWTLDLTGNQKTFQFMVDGKKMPGGVYSAATLPETHPLKSHFGGTGSLIVREAGTVLIFR